MARIALPFVARQFRLQCRIVDPIDFQREEYQVTADVSHPFAHGLIKLPVNRIGVVGGKQQLGVRHDPAQNFLDPFVFGDRHRQPRSGSGRELSRITLLERAGRGIRLVKVGPQDRTIRRRIKVGKIPDRQVSLRLRGFGHRDAVPSAAAFLTDVG